MCSLLGAAEHRRADGVAVTISTTDDITPSCYTIPQVLVGRSDAMTNQASYDKLLVIYEIYVRIYLFDASRQALREERAEAEVFSRQNASERHEPYVVGGGEEPAM